MLDLILVSYVKLCTKVKITFLDMSSNLQCHVTYSSCQVTSKGQITLKIKQVTYKCQITLKLS